MSLGSLLPQVASVTSVQWVEAIVATAASGSCSKTTTRSKPSPILNQAAVIKLLSSAVPSCLKRMLTTARNELASRGNTSNTMSLLSAAVNRLAGIVSAQEWAKIGSFLGDVLRCSIGKSAADRKLGFGFRVFADHAPKRL